MARWHRTAAALILAAATAWPAWAVEDGRSTGRPVPRFVSLSADTANLRAGPGERYPVEWVYKRARLPLKIVGEFGVWRRVRDWSGTQGWMHSALLAGRRTVQVVGDERTVMRENPAAEAAPVARLAPKAIGDLDRCRDGWCRATFAELTGWVRADALYGADADP